jgi:hypothetical protein
MDRLLKAYGLGTQLVCVCVCVCVCVFVCVCVCVLVVVEGLLILRLPYACGLSTEVVFVLFMH